MVTTQGTSVRALGCEAYSFCISDIFPENGVRISPWSGEGGAYFDFGPVTSGSLGVSFTWVDNAWWSDWKTVEIYNWVSKTWERISSWDSADGLQHTSPYSISISPERKGPQNQVRVAIWVASGSVIQLNTISVH